MLKNDFYLLTDSSIICSYLVSKWIDNFNNFPNFRGILVKEETPSATLLQKRKLFHRDYAEKNKLTDEMYQKIIDIYPDIDETEKNMIRVFGVSKYSTTDYAKTFFLGNNVNGEYAQKVLRERANSFAPLIFACVTQILKPWWIEISNSQLFNVHSAVLP